MAKFKEDTNKKMMEVSARIDTLKAKIETKANCVKSGVGVEAEDKCCEIEEMREEVSELCMCLWDLKYTVSFLKEDMDYIFSRLSDHMDKHLPPAPSASHMQKAIDVLGWGEEYKVELPRAIYASDKRGGSFEIDLPKLKK